MKKFIVSVFVCFLLSSCATAMQSQSNTEAIAWQEAHVLVAKECFKGDVNYTPKQKDALKIHRCTQQIIDTQVMPVAVFPNILLTMRTEALDLTELYSKGKISPDKYKMESRRIFSDYTKTVEKAVQLDDLNRQKQISENFEKMSSNLKAQEQENFENKVWSTNPTFAACRYKGICNQQPFIEKQTIETTCQKIGNTTHCKSR